MKEIKPEEIGALIREQIKHYDQQQMMSLASEKDNKHFLEIMKAHFQQI